MGYFEPFKIKVIGKELAGRIKTFKILDRTLDELKALAESSDNEIIGLIGGIQINDTFIMASLVVGPQYSTPGSCRTENGCILRSEGEVERKGQLIGGQFHTHPRMTPFLSSVDRDQLKGLSRFHPDTISLVIGIREPTSYKIYKWDTEANRPLDITEQVQIIDSKLISIGEKKTIPTSIPAPAKVIKTVIKRVKKVITPDVMFLLAIAETTWIVCLTRIIISTDTVGTILIAFLGAIALASLFSLYLVGERAEKNKDV